MDDSFKFRKLTGPIEHWLTTLHQGYWGFRPDKKEAWKEIEENEVFVFHASSSEFLETERGALSNLDTGIIGLGRVGAKSEKDKPVWWEEIHHNGNYPYLIHFSEIYWFGHVTAIRDVPVADKDIDEMVRDVHRLAENIITFKEMQERTGYRIPAQGSPMNIRSPKKLFPLLRERINESIETDSVEEDGLSAGDTRLRTRSRDRDLDADQVSSREVTYKSSVHETIEGTIYHEQTLDAFEDYLKKRGFSGGETDHSDLIMKFEQMYVLAEAKSIHSGNESKQIRTGLGQLLEYRYRDIYANRERTSVTVTLCLVLSRAPSDTYREILKSVKDDGIFAFWIDEGNVDGLNASMRHITDLGK